MSPFPPPSLRLKAPEASLRPVSSLRVQTVNVPLMFGRPNITGNVGVGGGNTQNPPSGAFYIGNSPSQGYYASIVDTNTGRSMDASRQNDTYGKSVTVQPPSIRVLPCIKI